jgi:hypothetical protein
LFWRVDPSLRLPSMRDSCLDLKPGLADCWQRSDQRVRVVRHGHNKHQTVDVNRVDDRRDMRRFAAFAVILVGVLAWAPFAFAQQPNSGGGEGGGVQGAVGGGGGNLPFTGLDLRVFVVAALVLLAGGLALRVLSTSRS